MSAIEAEVQRLLHAQRGHQAKVNGQVDIRDVTDELPLVSTPGGQFRFSAAALHVMAETADRTQDVERGFILCRDSTGSIVPGRRLQGGREGMALRDCRGRGEPVGHFHTHPYNEAAALLGPMDRAEQEMRQRTFSVADLLQTPPSAIACISGPRTEEITCVVRKPGAAIPEHLAQQMPDGYPYIPGDTPERLQNIIIGLGMYFPEVGRAFDYVEFQKGVLQHHVSAYDCARGDSEAAQRGQGGACQEIRAGAGGSGCRDPKESATQLQCAV